MADNRKRKRASLGESGQKKTTAQQQAAQALAAQAANEMQALQQNGNLQLENYLRLHCREALLEYLEHCPLLQCCASVTRIDSDAFLDPFVQLVIRQTHPVQGVCFSLKTYMAALQALVSDSLCTVAMRDDARRPNSAVVLSVETESRDTMAALARSNLLLSGEVSISNDRNLLALYNDRELDYLSQYALCNRPLVVFFTLTLHDRLVGAMIVPAREHHYELQSRVNHHIRSHATLEAESRELRLQLQQLREKTVAPTDNPLQAPLDEAKMQLVDARLALQLRDQRIGALELQAEGLKRLAQKAVAQAKTKARKAKRR
jgi:hypothetical protein